jgi:hypothetical protein
MWIPVWQAAAVAVVDHENNDMVPVLILLPVVVPIGFSKPTPSGSLANEGHVSSNC